MSEIITFTLRTERATMEKFKHLAEYNGRSANKELEQLMIQTIRKFEKENGEIRL